MSRVFIIGSGPSLAKTPVDDLIGEDVFVMNKANHLWKHFGWKLKPKYYFKLDYNYYDREIWKEQVYWAADHCQKLFLWEQFRTGYKVGHSNYETMPDGVGNLPGVNVEWISKCKHTAYQSGNWKATQSWHLPTLCTAFGSINPIMQICAMEYDEIYLLGCDLGYTGDSNKNHAYPGYDTDPRDKSEQDQRNMSNIHAIARRCSPVPIYNATIGGSLETYPRVDIFELLKGRKEYA